MPMKVCANADVGGGILPTLPRWCLLPTIYEATPYRYNGKIGLKQWVVVKMAGKMPTKVCTNVDIAGGILSALPSDALITWWLWYFCRDDVVDSGCYKDLS